MEEIKANIFVAKKKLKLREGFFFKKKTLAWKP